VLIQPRDREDFFDRAAEKNLVGLDHALFGKAHFAVGQSELAANGKESAPRDPVEDADVEWGRG